MHVVEPNHLVDLGIAGGRTPRDRLGFPARLQPSGEIAGFGHPVDYAAAVTSAGADLGAFGIGEPTVAKHEDLDGAVLRERDMVETRDNLLRVVERRLQDY